VFPEASLIHQFSLAYAAGRALKLMPHGWINDELSIGSIPSAGQHAGHGCVRGSLSHGSQAATPKHMKVQVIDGLSTPRTGVGRDSIAIQNDVFLFSDGLSCQEQCTRQ